VSVAVIGPGNVTFTGLVVWRLRKRKASSRIGRGRRTGPVTRAASTNTLP
jgi:hypothetical protein